MSSAENNAKTWTKPQLDKLGTLKDVAGPSGSGSEGGPNSKS